MTVAYTVQEVPPRGLLKHPLHEVRDEDNKTVLTCETRPLAEKWAARFTERFSR